MSIEVGIFGRYFGEGNQNWNSKANAGGVKKLAHI